MWAGRAAAPHRWGVRVIAMLSLLNDSVPGWTVEASCFDAATLDQQGSRFMIGNGAVGVRGTLEELGREQLAACTLAGLYDQVPGCWREPVNAPNPFLCRVWCDGTLLSPLSLKPRSHRQWIDLRHAVHRRETVFVLSDGNEVSVEATRFLSATDVHAGFANCRVGRRSRCLCRRQRRRRRAGKRGRWRWIIRRMLWPRCGFAPQAWSACPQWARSAAGGRAEREKAQRRCGAWENAGGMRIAVFARFVVETVARSDFGRAWMLMAAGAERYAFLPPSRGANPMCALENTTNLL